METVTADLQRYIVETWLSGDGRGLEPETDLQASGLLDSFAVLALVGHVSDAFQVALEPADINAMTFRCVSSIARLVVDRMAGERATKRSD